MESILIVSAVTRMHSRVKKKNIQKIVLKRFYLKSILNLESKKKKFSV